MYRSGSRRRCGSRSRRGCRNRHGSRLLELSGLLILHRSRLTRLNRLLILLRGLLVHGLLILGNSGTRLHEGLVELRLLGGIAVGVDPGVLAEREHCLIGDTEDNVAKNSVLEDTVYSGIAAGNALGNADENKEDRQRVISDPDHGQREKMLAVHELYGAACVRILCFRTENEHVQNDTDCDSSDQSDQQNEEISQEGAAHGIHDKIVHKKYLFSDNYPAENSGGKHSNLIIA